MLFFIKRQNTLTIVNISISKMGKFIINNEECYSVNTCSIDYFLIIIYIIRSNHKDQFNQLKNTEIGNVFESIYIHLSYNDWQKARIAWLNYCPGLEKAIKKNNVFDWFLSEYESFFVFYRSNQFYSWISKYNNKSGQLCINSFETTKHSYTYILK